MKIARRAAATWPKPGYFWPERKPAWAARTDYDKTVKTVDKIVDFGENANICTVKP